MEYKAQVFEGGRLGQHMLLNMPCARSCAIEDNDLCLGGAVGEAKGLTKSWACYPEGFGVRWTSKIAARISSAYTGEDTHLSEPSWAPACGAVLSRWPYKPSNKSRAERAPLPRSTLLKRPGGGGGGGVIAMPPTLMQSMMTANIGGLTPMASKQAHSRSCWTVSSAFCKFTKTTEAAVARWPCR